jgi:hypothetical protein
MIGLVNCVRYGFLTYISVCAMDLLTDSQAHDELEVTIVKIE